MRSAISLKDALLGGAIGLLLAGAGPAPAADSSAADKPDMEQLMAPFLGTWSYPDEISPGPDLPPYAVERYLLLRWQKGKLRVKTYEWLPDRKTRARESDWNGMIHEDRWNVTQQTFTPMADGTISVGLGGSNGIGSNPNRQNWWAAGRMVLEEGEDGPVLRYTTHQGYVPSSKGNLWQPFDRSYQLVSREIDPEFLGRRRR